MSARATAWGAYKSISDVLRRRIVAGEFAAGSLLPSEAALTKEFSVSRNTLRRALSDLESEGLIRALPGRGRIVTSPDEPRNDASNPHLQYRRTAAELREKIERGELRPGELLPSEAALTVEFSVSRNTLRRALSDLESEGLIRALPGRGRVVTSPDEPRNDPSNPHLQYRRIAAELREKIERGELRPGELLPSEAALTAQYGVSRWTARQALVELQGAGLVDAVHGKGRFVRERPAQDV